jgi:uncharacterized protein YndB with AHSA1/START domain
MQTVTVPEPSASDTAKVEIRRVIRATRQRIYQAWTRPEEIVRWFGPGAIHVTEAETDLRPGGEYSITMKGSIDGNPEQSERIIPVSGNYQELVPDTLIRFTWKPAWTPDEVSEVTVRLQEVEGGTEVVLTHERLTTMESRTGHARGWTASLEKLDQYLSR